MIYGWKAVILSPLTAFWFSHLLSFDWLLKTKQSTTSAPRSTNQGARFERGHRPAEGGVASLWVLTWIFLYTCRMDADVWFGLHISLHSASVAANQMCATAHCSTLFGENKPAMQECSVCVCVGGGRVTKCTCVCVSLTDLMLSCMCSSYTPTERHANRQKIERYEHGKDKDRGRKASCKPVKTLRALKDTLTLVVQYFLQSVHVCVEEGKTS